MQFVVGYARRCNLAFQLAINDSLFLHPFLKTTSCCYKVSHTMPMHSGLVFWRNGKATAASFHSAHNISKRMHKPKYNDENVHYSRTVCPQKRFDKEFLIHSISETIHASFHKWVTRNERSSNVPSYAFITSTGLSWFIWSQAENKYICKTHMELCLIDIE